MKNNILKKVTILSMIAIMTIGQCVSSLAATSVSVAGFTVSNTGFTSSGTNCNYYVYQPKIKYNDSTSKCFQALYVIKSYYDYYGNKYDSYVNTFQDKSIVHSKSV